MNDDQRYIKKHILINFSKSVYNIFVENFFVKNEHIIRDILLLSFNTKPN